MNVLLTTYRGGPLETCVDSSIHLNCHILVSDESKVAIVDALVHPGLELIPNNAEGNIEYPSTRDLPDLFGLWKEAKYMLMSLKKVEHSFKLK